MLEMQAAIGRIQLRRMPEWTSRRRVNAAALVEALRPFDGVDGPIRLPKLRCDGCGAAGCGIGGAQTCIAGCVHGHYKFYAYVRPQNLASGWNRDRIIEAINARGVPCYQGSCSEVYLEKAFENMPWRPHSRLTNARELGETSLLWLVHPTLSRAETQKMVNVSTSVLAEAMKR
jgi:dTDP-4-amino-4,6-dideoxygalactose transaminase